MRVRVSVADLLSAPDGVRERQVIFGDQVAGNTAHPDELAAYDGYIPAAALGPDFTPTHWVHALSTHAYDALDMKSPDLIWLPYGARVEVLEKGAKFHQTPQGFIPAGHLTPLSQMADDPAAEALKFLGTPYLWGGNSPRGIDCSGLIHAALRACGVDCPSDSTPQMAHFKGPPPKSRARNQLYFWAGHVALGISDTHLIHANAHTMSVAVEGIDATIKRIKIAGDGPLLMWVGI